MKSLARTAKDEAEGEAIRQALEQTNWNRKQAAALLQISYKALLYKIRQYGIAESQEPPQALRRGLESGLESGLGIRGLESWTRTAQSSRRNNRITVYGTTVRLNGWLCVNEPEVAVTVRE